MIGNFASSPNMKSDATQSRRAAATAVAAKKIAYRPFMIVDAEAISSAS
jgi:hypothetical protein